MAIGNVKTTNHIRGFKEEINKAAKGDVHAFFNWFDELEGDLDTYFINGQCNFTSCILMPSLKFLSNIKEKTALEIGSGGGRLLAGASQYFKEVIGVDIHENIDIVETELKKRNITNCKLLQSEGKNLPVGDNSVDFVFSFIVLQHLEKIEIFQSYVRETYRVLKPGGIAILFFAKLHSFSLGRESKLLYNLDKLLEKTNKKGYKEVLAQVNCVNLRVSLSYAKKLSRDLGFTVLGEGVSKKLPEMTKYGGQHYLILKK